jgi:hypothetical protein
MLLISVGRRGSSWPDCRRLVGSRVRSTAVRRPGRFQCRVCACRERRLGRRRRRPEFRGRPRGNDERTPTSVPGGCFPPDELSDGGARDDCSSGNPAVCPAPRSSTMRLLQSTSTDSLLDGVDTAALLLAAGGNVANGRVDRPSAATECCTAGTYGMSLGQTAAPSSIVGEPAATSMRTAASCVSRSARRDDMQSWWHTVRPPCVSSFGFGVRTKVAPTRGGVSARQWEWSFDCDRAFSFFRRWVQLRADGFLFVELTGLMSCGARSGWPPGLRH